MNRSLKLYALTGLAFGMSTFSSEAAESKVYHFKDGTVTITPRDSQASLAQKVETDRNCTATNSAPAPTPALSEQPILIRPVSHSQINPAPIPDEVVQPVAQTPAPGSAQPSLQPTPIPPENAATPCCDQQPIILPRSTDALPKSTTTLSMAAMYRDVYNSIPFSRVEFNHYPNYRHDATMEFLFNQMRTTIINRNTGSAGNDYTYGPAYGGYTGYPYYDPPAYPFSYGLRIHRSR